MKVEINNISKTYNMNNEMRTSVLNSFSMEVASGEMLALMAPSGAGKSTLLNIIGTLDSADAGEIIYSNSNETIKLSKLKNNELNSFRNQKLGFIFQFHNLLPELTALENIATPALIGGGKWKDAEAKAMELLDFVGLAERAKHRPAEMSGGEQQRVAIARAFINSPQLVLADEPTGNLDEANTEMVIELFQKLKKKFDFTLITATHSKFVGNSLDRIVNITTKES